MQNTSETIGNYTAVMEFVNTTTHRVASGERDIQGLVLGEADIYLLISTIWTQARWTSAGGKGKSLTSVGGKRGKWQR